MNFKILSEEGRPFEFLYQRNERMARFNLAGSVFLSVSEPFGTMLFQQYFSKAFSISYSVFLMEYSYRPLIYFDEPTLYLNLIQHNDLYIEGLGIGGHTLKDGYFNIRYLPYTNCRLCLLPGLSSEFGLYYDPAYLQRYAGHYPAVCQLLDKVSLGHPGYLLPSYVPADKHVLNAVDQVLKSEYDGEMRDLFLEYKALEILSLSLRSANLTSAHAPPSRKEFEQMEEARTWLAAHADNPGTLSEIARRVGTNEFALKKNFKRYYHFTVFEYVLKLKMDHAMQLLQDTKLPVTDIAYQSGYSSIPSFSKAFRRYFNISPSQVRKK